MVVKNPYADTSKRVARFVALHSKPLRHKKVKRKRVFGRSYPSARYLMGHKFQDYSSNYQIYERNQSPIGWRNEPARHALSAIGVPSGRHPSKRRATYISPRTVSDREEFINRRRSPLPVRVGERVVQGASQVKAGYQGIREEASERGATPLPEPTKLWQSRYVTPANIALYGGKVVGGLKWLEKRREASALKAKQEKERKAYEEAQKHAEETRLGQGADVLAKQTELEAFLEAKKKRDALKEAKKSIYAKETNPYIPERVIPQITEPEKKKEMPDGLIQKILKRGK